MSQVPERGPSAARATDGIVHRRSPHSVADTVDRLVGAIKGAGAKLFAVVDHSGEAELVGLSLRNTKLVIFGSPLAGTPVMHERPLAALDLPLKVLVWADDGDAIWMSYLSADWLAERHAIAAELVRPLRAVDTLTERVRDVQLSAPAYGDASPEPRLLP